MRLSELAKDKECFFFFLLVFVQLVNLSELLVVARSKCAGRVGQVCAVVILFVFFVFVLFCLVFFFGWGEMGSRFDGGRARRVSFLALYWG